MVLTLLLHKDPVKLLEYLYQELIYSLWIRSLKSHH